jgi:hypothetical protein
MKRSISILLLAALILSGCSETEPQVTQPTIDETIVIEDEEDPDTDSSDPPVPASLIAGIPSNYADIDKQLVMISQMHETWLTSGDDPDFYYAVTDMDNNGRLEVLYMTEHDGQPELNVYEISPTYDSLEELPFEGDAVPELLSNNHYRRFFDGETYKYIVHDYTMDDLGNGMINKVAMYLVDGVVHFDVLGYEVILHDPDYRPTFYDANGRSLPDEDEFNKLPDEVFAGQDMEMINVETLSDYDAELEDITHSFKTFLGLQESDYVYEYTF